MRILTFKGKFGYIHTEINHGLIAFCQFEDNDTNSEIKNAAKNLCKMAGVDSLILVPFSHLSNNVAPSHMAEELFNSLNIFCSEIKNESIIVAPFGVDKEFHLYTSANNEAIRFLTY